MIHPIMSCERFWKKYLVAGSGIPHLISLSTLRNLIKGESYHSFTSFVSKANVNYVNNGTLHIFS